MKALRRSNTSSPSSSSPSSSWIHLRSLLIVASSPAPDRGSLKSPWSRRKRKSALSHRQWISLFSPDGKLRDGGVKFLKKARSGGIDPSIRAEVWPFLLGVYDLNSTDDERNITKKKKRAGYEILRRRCRRLLNHRDKVYGLKGVGEVSKKGSPSFDRYFNARPSLTIEDGSDEEDLPKFDKTPDRTAYDVQEGSDYEVQPVYDRTPNSSACTVEEGSGYEDPTVYDKSPNSSSCNVGEGTSGTTCIDESAEDSESSYSESSNEEEHESMLVPFIMEGIVEPDPNCAKIPLLKGDFPNRTAEDFATWQRIIRLDAVRANAEWVIYYPDQSVVSEAKANQSALAVGLRDYDHLEPCMIHHAARLVAVLEAYTLYDPEIGYCQGMSDLLSPILAVMEEDHEAFWCFVGFMRKARHNFRLDEVGIRRQLGIVAKIIKSKDLHLYRHLEKLQAEDCFFVYRMVVVLFRRELSFEQTVCLWEVMWADQAAIRAGIGKSIWGRIRLRAAPPTDDLLLYAIAACVLQRRKLIIEKYNSMDEIIRECNDMAGQLDVWRLLDDAHDLVVTLHDKV